MVEASELTVLNEINRVRAEARPPLPPLQLTHIEGTRDSAVTQRENNRLGHPVALPREGEVGEICAHVVRPINAIGQWLRSPPHRAIMLSNRTHIDIAVEQDNRGYYYVVARIGRGGTRTVTREWETLADGTTTYTRTIERTVEPGSRVPMSVMSRQASGMELQSQQIEYEYRRVRGRLGIVRTIRVPIERKENDTE